MTTTIRNTANMLVMLLCLSTANAAWAESYRPFHARTLGMGDTGVASANASAAALFNPALLAAQESSKDFEVLFPAIGVSVADEDELLDQIDEDVSNLIDEWDNKILQYNALFDQFNSNPGSVNRTQIDAAVNDVVNTLDTLNSQLLELDGKALNGNVNFLFNMSIPNDDFAMSLTASAVVLSAVRGNYKDEAIISDFGPALNDLTDDLINGTASTDSSKSYAQYVESVSSGGSDVELKTPDLESEGEVVIVALGELGLSLAREFDFGGNTIALGITPKYQYVRTVDFTAQAVEDEENGFDDIIDDAEDSQTNDSNLNIDVGAAYTVGNWRIGLSARNLIGQEYKTDRGRKIKLNPLLRTGAAYFGNGFTLAADLDLTELDGVFNNSESQYASLGAEIDVNLVQLRGGYRHNLSDGDDKLLTAGVGFSLLGAAFELSLISGRDNDESGAVFQMGFRF